jgi:hypothetical protein
MGLLMKEDDYFIEPLLDALNMRFAPGEPIGEMIDLQKHFSLFQAGRSFKDSVRIIGAGIDDRQATKRWYELLEWLGGVGSDTEQNGSDRIVSALVQNLESRKPRPVYFTYHIASKRTARVQIRKQQKAVSFMRNPFLTISLPMIPRPASA